MLNYGVVKERLIATKAVDAAVVQSIKIIGYLSVAGIGEHVLLFGFVAGVGAFIGNLMGKKVLSKMPVDRFRNLAGFVIMVSGALLLFRFAGVLE